MWYKYYGFMLNSACAGEKEVDEQDDIFILVAPQNAVGNCIIDVRVTPSLILSILLADFLYPPDPSFDHEKEGRSR